MPAMMPGSASGSVTVRNSQIRLAPSVAAASSSRRSIASIDSRIARTISGKRHDAAGQRGAGPAEREHDAEMIGEERADRRPAAERDEQQIAGDHRRQHQRQMTTASSSALPQKSLRASSLAMAMPNGSATTVATTAMRSDSATAVHSWRRRARTRYEIGLIKKLKPYFSNIALAAAPRRKLRYRATALSCRSRRRHRIGDRRIGAVRKHADDLHLRLDLGVGLVDDAERRLAARHEGERRAHVLGHARASAPPPPRRRASPAPPWRIARPAPLSRRRRRCGRRRRAWRCRSPGRSSTLSSLESSGAISTSLLPSRLTRVSGLISLCSAA